MWNFITYWGITSQLLVAEAEKMGLQVEILQPHKNFFKLTKGEKTVYFKLNDFGGNSALGAKIADDKELADIFLRSNGFPTPQSYYLSKAEKGNFNLSTTGLTYPLVTKPVDWAHGNGVTANITTPELLQEGIELAFSFSDTIIIQKFIPWDEHRILVIGDQVRLGYKRIPAHVVGDGIHTIKELTTAENQNPLRGNGYETPLSHIPMNDKTTKYLQLHWLSLSTIPKHWETIQLTSVSNVGQWGTLLEITNQICEEVKTQCVAIAKKVWLVVVWIDIITTDLSVPLHVSWGTIIEINAAPWFWWDQTFSLVNTPKLLLEHIFN